MEYNLLGNSDLKVSKICLGTMTFGEQNTKSEAFEQLDYALDQGVNFIDTAEMYPVPPIKETYTKTESYIGQWSKLKSQRDKVILATKVAGPMAAGYIRSGNNNLSKENIKAAVDGSLKRLNTDYIDLYQLHWPDRQTNFFGERGFTGDGEDQFTPFLESLQTLSDLIKEGKIRYFGLSNETPWGVMSYLSIAKENNLPTPISIQNPYNLLNRIYETGLSEVSLRENIPLLAYSPLAFGVLSGKYLNNQKPEGARLTKWERFSRYNKPQGIAATEKYCQLAQKFDMDPVTLALAFVNQQSFVSSNIIGATKMEQLKLNINSIKEKLSPELTNEINQLQEVFTNPCP